MNQESKESFGSVGETKNNSVCNFEINHVENTPISIVTEREPNGDAKHYCVIGQVRLTEEMAWEKAVEYANTPTWKAIIEVIAVLINMKDETAKMLEEVKRRNVAQQVGKEVADVN